MNRIQRFAVRSCITLVLLLFVNSKSNAQIQNLLVNSYNNIVKLNFLTSPPTLSYTGIDNGFEAIAHAEDGLGNILFFVNADGIYNAHNVLMPGSGNIYANSSASEIDICPFPNNPEKYYVFYNAELCSSLYYSVVDMKLDDGRGDVISLNTLIDSTEVAEGLEIIKRPCRNSYWLIVYACGLGFKRYLIDENGISSGTIIYNYSGPKIYLGRGELDYSNGKMGISFSNSPVSTAFICDFDAYTGIIANPKTILLPTGGNGLYGMEFSPDGSKAYMTKFYENNKNNLFQYDFETEKITSYYITSTAADSFDVTGPGQIELGSDGKLYIPFDNGNQITVINNPNSLSPEFSKITTNSKLGLGISDHIQSEIYKVKNNFTFSHVCLSETTDFIFESGKCSNHTRGIMWNFGDKKSGRKNTSSDSITSHLFSEAGIYNVNLYVSDSLGTDTISHKITISTYPKVYLGNDTSICQNTSIILDPHISGMSYNWSTSEYKQKINISTAGKYWVKINNKGCCNSDTILIKILPIPNVDVGPDLWLCKGKVQMLNAGVVGKSYFWSTGEKKQNIKIDSEGSYWVAVSNGLCTSSDTVDITFEPSPKVDLGNDTTICGNDSLVLNAFNNGASYLWSTGDTSNTIQVNKTGTYFVNVILGICIVSDTVKIINRGIIPLIKVPAKYSLNSNLNNCNLEIVTKNVDFYHIIIINDVGKVVYESFDPNKDWDGKIGNKKSAGYGVYHYIIEYNTPCNFKKAVKKGIITLSR